MNKLLIALSCVSFLAIAGCSVSAADDPLTGNWKNTECFGLASKPADIDSCSTELDFTVDLDVKLIAKEVSLAATATHPGCTTTKIASGQKWSTDSTTVAITGSSAATLQRASCVNETDNQAATTTTDISIPAGDSPYTISGNTLTIASGALKGIYTR